MSVDRVSGIALAALALLVPDVPTFKELGYAEAEFYIWAGVFAPKATPEPVLARLRATVREAVNDPEFKAAMDKLQTPVTFKQGDEFQRFFEAHARRLAEGVAAWDASRRGDLRAVAARARGGERLGLESQTPEVAA